MNILFLHPVQKFPFIQHYQLGLQSLIGYLRAHGHHAEYYPVSELDAGKLDFNPEIDIIGIYTLETMLDYIGEIVEQLKDKFYILLGGPCATVAPELCSEKVYYDALCRGEGEQAILELIASFGTGNKEIESFWFDCGTIRNGIRSQVSEEVIQSYPMPANEYILEVKRYYTMAMAMNCTHIIATRGCPFSCKYCCNSTYNGLLKHGVRYKSINQIEQEIDTTLATRGLVIFEDDILNANKKWFQDLLKLFKNKYKKRQIIFEMNTRVNCISKQEVLQAKEAGCVTIRFGVESGSPRVREILGRNTMTNSDILSLGKTVVDAGLYLYLCSIIGAPGETEEDFQETYKIVKELYDYAQDSQQKCTIILNSYYPLHGTPLGDHCHKNGLVTKDIKGIGAHVQYGLNSTLSKEFVIQQQRRFRKEFTGMLDLEPAENA